jgi:hypothetical protein
MDIDGTVSGHALHLDRKNVAMQYWIRDILVRIRIRTTDKDPDPDPASDPALYISDLQDANKKLFFLFFLITF